MALSNLGLEPSQIFCGKLLREYVNLFFPSNYRERGVDEDLTGVWFKEKYFRKN